MKVGLGRGARSHCVELSVEELEPVVEVVVEAVASRVDVEK